jgi:purine nucleosidase
MRSIIIDTDLNFPSDDFQALLLLLNEPDVAVLGCCAAAGNTWAEEVEVNIGEALGLAGRLDIPLLRGLSFESFARRHAPALELKRRGLRSFIGAFEKSERPRLWITGAAEGNKRVPAASDFIVQAGRLKPGQIDLICLGPLTNVAQALKAAPDLPLLLRRVFVMGGNFEATGPKADSIDFNVWFDPEAAQSVLDSGLRVVLLPLEVCRSAAVSPALIEAVCLHHRGLAGLFVDDFLGMVVQHGPSMPLCDQLLALIACDPGLVSTAERGRVQVDCTASANRGQTRFQANAAGSVELIRSVSVDRLRQRLLSCLAALEHCPAPLPARLGSLTTPRFKYLIQRELESATVRFQYWQWDESTIQRGPMIEVRQALDFARHAASILPLLETGKKLGEWPFQAKPIASAFQSGKEMEQLLLDRLGGAALVSLAKGTEGNACGVSCLSRVPHDQRQDIVRVTRFELPQPCWIHHFNVVAVNLRRRGLFKQMSMQLLKWSQITSSMPPAPVATIVPPNCVEYGAAVMSLGYRVVGEWDSDEGRWGLFLRERDAP